MLFPLVKLFVVESEKAEKITMALIDFEVFDL